MKLIYMFCKPNQSGSSFESVRCIFERTKPAVEKALKEGNEVLIESFLKGREVCECLVKWED